MALTFNVFCKSDNCFSTSFLHTPQAYFTFAKQIFHIKDISLVPTEQISLKKAFTIMCKNTAYSFYNV